MRDAGQWREAANAYRHWLLFNPGDAAMWKQLGHMRTEAAAFDDAARAYARANDLAPGDDDLFVCWARSRALAGDPDGAEALYRRSFAVNGNLTSLEAIAALRAAPQTSDAPARAAPLEDFANRTIPGAPLPDRPDLATMRSRGLRVALYGPWNYENGLGAASRGLIGALRRTGARLNLHPIRKPFHIHRRLVPPVDVRDFDEPADIAIVHLNPDSWHLLTPDQIASIKAAHWRIGYWVWEMDQLPIAWRREVALDRLWAPSRYCADIFERQTNLRVDRIPHPIIVPDGVPIDRARVLDTLGLPPAQRVILYIFDGASYLVRKNPAALVRAFARSGLANAGWSLVLKTKHLMDRSSEGEAFAALAASVENVVLIDKLYDRSDLDDLLRTADIYASPHCAEGFGLTIAEAMALGKPVVATDFGGSRDFLDADSGYPVAAQPWSLERSFGHYPRGSSWARIDEAALAAALVDAADAVSRGDERIGTAARARIEQMLSPDRIATSISRSFDALVDDGTGRATERRA